MGSAPAWTSLEVVINHAPSSGVMWGVGFEITHYIFRGFTEVAQVRSIYSQNYHTVTDTWKSDPIASHLSFCTKGIHARSCRIHCFKKRRKTFSLGRRCPSGRMRGGGKSPSLAFKSKNSWFRDDCIQSYSRRVILGFHHPTDQTLDFSPCFMAVDSTFCKSHFPLPQRIGSADKKFIRFKPVSRNDLRC